MLCGVHVQQLAPRAERDTLMWLSGLQLRGLFYRPTPAKCSRYMVLCLRLRLRRFCQESYSERGRACVQGPYGLHPCHSSRLALAWVVATRWNTAANGWAGMLFERCVSGVV